MTYLKFNWAPNEKLFEIGGFGIHIYSLMFIIAFLLGLRLYKKMFIKENVDQKYLENIKLSKPSSYNKNHGID